jgi:hypothetical protein
MQKSILDQGILHFDISQAVDNTTEESLFSKRELCESKLKADILNQNVC